MSENKDILHLVQGCKKGDIKSQEKLYRETYAFAIRIAIRYTKNQSDIPDILSQAYLNVFRSIQSFDPQKGIFFSWLKRVIINEAIDFYKKHQPQSEIEANTAEESSIQNEAISSIATTEIMRAVSKLPPATHAVFIMYVIDDYSHKEIAHIMGISIGTSKWHLNQARTFLQERLLPKYK